MRLWKDQTWLRNQGKSASGKPRAVQLWINMRAENVTDTLDLVLQASGYDQVHVVHKPRLLSELTVIAPWARAIAGDGSSHVLADLAE